MIHISATGLRDLLTCEKMFHYRIYNPHDAIVTPEIIFGKIIHKAIQNYTEKNDALDYVMGELENISRREFISAKGFSEKARICIENYYDMIVPQLSDGEAFIEHKFFIPINKKIAITGTMDRIQNNCIYDWKTTTKSPDGYTLSELQFYVYWWSYRKKFKKDPQNIYYGHLYSGVLYTIDMDRSRMDNLENLLDKATKMVYNGLKARTTGSHCGRCLFRGICYSEFEDVSTS